MSGRHQVCGVHSLHAQPFIPPAAAAAATRTPAGRGMVSWFDLDEFGGRQTHACVVVVGFPGC